MTGISILVLTDGFPPEDMGGIPQAVQAEVESLASKGHRIVVVTRQMRKECPSHEFVDGRYHIFRYNAPISKTISWWLHPADSMLHTGKIVKKLHKVFNFDLAYVHNTFQAISLTMALNKIPYVFCYHAPMTREMLLEIKHKKYGKWSIVAKRSLRLIRCLEEKALKGAALIITRSQYIASEIYQVHGCRVNVAPLIIPLGINEERFAYATSPLEERKHINFLTDNPLFLTVRRLVSRMGLEVLIEAMNIIKKNHHLDDFLMLIGGTGYMKPVLEGLVKQYNLNRHVHFLGYIPDEQLPNYYASSDLFVLPTNDLEGFGLVSLEAMSCGTPVVATEVGANKEVIGGYDIRWLCPPKNPELLAAKIVQTWKLGRNEFIRRRVHEYCLSHFSIKKVVSSLEQAFASILA